MDRRPDLIRPLWETELEDAVEALSGAERQSAGGGRTAIRPTGSRTCGDHFTGRRRNPGYKVGRVFDLLSTAGLGGPSEAEGILARRRLPLCGHKGKRIKSSSLQNSF